jgi:tRNA (cytosine38-C5)-methyltransferase
VYAHNLGKRPSQKPIEKLDASALDGVADVWAMSPPCQPHTRQRKGLDAQATDKADPRSLSFLHLCGLLGTLASPPATVVLENVVGFESSKCCGTLLAALGVRGYTVQQFHLTPTQFGFPNDRPRFYLVATRPAGASGGGGATLVGPSSCLQRALPRARKRKLSAESAAEEAEVDEAAVTLAADEVHRGNVDVHLELPRSYDAPLAGLTPGGDGGGEGDSGVENSSVGGGQPRWLAKWAVSDDLLAKDAAWCFDIVRPSDSHTACFTSSYGRFVKGTGSVLFVPKDRTSDSPPPVMTAEVPFSGPDARVSPEARLFGDSWRAQVGSAGTLRYFTPREVANLMGFPKGKGTGNDTGDGVFELPAGLKARKAYELLGNSLHVGVAARVLALALGL